MKIQPQETRIADYTYDLPEDRIALHPLAERDRSRLLIYRKGNIRENIFGAIASEIPRGSLLVFNTTRVVHARLLFRRNSGALVEIFCTDSASPAIPFTSLLQAASPVELTAFVGNGKRWKEGEKLSLVSSEQNLHLYAERISQQDAHSVVRLSWEPAEKSLAEILETAGKVPLPPYLNREQEPGDSERYQTIYAKQEGSVAAPTAGLHFTEKTVSTLREKGVHFAELTLHVGAGTFKPVKSETMGGHEMHREQFFVSAKTIDALLDQQQKPVIAVGTTALRTLESIYWFGRSLVLNPGRYAGAAFVPQWEPYASGPDVPAEIALRTVADWMREYNRDEFSGYTQLLIQPGYRFRIADALITNFHQPQSTLLLLVAAFTGDDFRKIYDYALQHGFRFLSYGDSSLLWRKM